MTEPRTVSLALELEGVTPTAIHPRAFEIGEALFDCYEARITVECHELVDVDALVGTKATFRIVLGGDVERLFHGVVFEASIDAKARDVEVYDLEVVIVPRLRILSLGRNSRIFQETSVPDIVKKVLEEGGLASDDFSIDLRASYEALPYVVQYLESDYDFVRRLLHDEGIGFAIHNDIDREVVRIFDDAADMPPIEGTPTMLAREATRSDHDVIFELRERLSAASDAVMLRDYDLTRPALDLSAKEEAEGAIGREVYDHPGGYSEEAAGKQRAKRLLERLQLGTRTFSGKTDNPRLEPGRTFTLEGHPRADSNGELRVLSIRHRGDVTADDDDDDASGLAGGRAMYVADFEAIMADVAYRPVTAPTPEWEGGIQIAFVTCPPGEEIHCDDYGRVKVRFTWDRAGAEDDTSSTFLRVGQLALGGSMLIPRGGFEILVDHELSDIDRPYVIGHLYNGEARPPYELPGGAVRNSLQTATTQSGGGANELRFDDTAGSEQIFFNASKDMTVSVENDATVNIDNDERSTIGGNRTVLIGTDCTARVGGSRTIVISGEQKITAGGNLNVGVGGSDTLTAGTRKVVVGGDFAENTTGSLTRTVSALQMYTGIATLGRKVVGSSSQKVGGAWLEGAKLSRAVSATNFVETIGALKMVKAKAVNVSCGAAYSMQAASHNVECAKDRTDSAKGILSLAAGGGLKIKADNIVISGKSKVTIKGGGVTITLSSDGTIKVKASKLDLRGVKAVSQAIHKSA